MLTGTVIIMLFRLVALTIGFTLHELGHALASVYLGDPTPRLQRRLSLNPLRHLDPTGALAMFLMVTMGWFFAWAKPVQIDPRYYPNFRRGMILVAAAGPLMNFIIALMGAALYGILIQLGIVSPLFSTFISILIIWNLVLMVFNLIPIPPLDGGKILAMLLPGPTAFRYLTWGEQWGLGVILALIFIDLFIPGLPISPFTLWFRAWFAALYYLLELVVPVPLPQPML